MRLRVQAQGAVGCLFPGLYFLAMGITARKDTVILVTLCIGTCPELCSDSVTGLGREPSTSDPLWKGV